MQTMKFVTMTDERVVCWCTTNDLKIFRDFMQYILDSCPNPEKFLIWDVGNDNVYNMRGIACNQFGMRKRNFDERMNGVQTGKWKNMKI